MTVFGPRRASQMASLEQDTRLSEAEDSSSPDDFLFADINWPDYMDRTSDEMDEMADCVPGYDNCSRTPSGSSSKSSDHESSHMTGVPGSMTSTNDSTSYAYETDITGDCYFGQAEKPATDAAPGPSAKKCQFTKEVRSILRTWYHEHKDNPYPTSKEKDVLVERTKLTRNQLSLWLANTRRKQRARKQQQLQKQQRADTLALPQGPMEDMNPMDRWKVLPIELEAVAAPTIIAACAESPPPASFDEVLDDDVRYQASLFDVESTNASRYTAADMFSESRFGTSLASRETGMTSFIGSSAMSDHTSFSYHSLNPSVSYSLTSRDRRRRRCNVTKAPKPAAKYKSRPFQCTFCPDNSFVTKHDWQRHEKAQHLSLESWTCCLDGGIMDSDEGLICAFCDHLNPDTAHLETHSFSACQIKDFSERTFYRKDHFQQHLRLTHDAKILPRMGLWKSTLENVKSRCGFCSATFTTWAQRVDHLAAHFKSKATMQDWVGDLGFEPHIAALVERSTPHTHSQSSAQTSSSTSPLEQNYSNILQAPSLKPVYPQTQTDIDYGANIDADLVTYQQPFEGGFQIDPILEFSRGLEGTTPICLDTAGLDIDVMDWAFGL